MKEPSVSPHAEANGNVAFALDGRKEPKSHVLSVPSSEVSYPSTPLSVRSE